MSDAGEQLDLLELLAAPAPARPMYGEGARPCWCGHARTDHALLELERPGWAACSQCPCLGHHGPPGLTVAHAGRHKLWAWHLVWALDGRRDALLAVQYGSGGTCDGCGGWWADSRGITLAEHDFRNRGLQPTRYTWRAVLRELDRRAVERPELVAEILALGTDGYDPRRVVLADDLWGAP